MEEACLVFEKVCLNLIYPLQFVTHLMVLENSLC